jgi:hypothetical protein
MVGQVPGRGDRRIEMKSATKSPPRFRVGDWVSYASGDGRILGQIVEDRGLLGFRGSRLYGIRLDRSQPYPRTTAHPEADLEPAPDEILDAEVVRQKGFRTDNWPCVEFNFRYIRKGKTNAWTAMAELRHLVEGEDGNVRTGYATVLTKWDPTGDKNVADITVWLAYDPRLRDPRDHPSLWQALREEARRLADERFQDRHRKAMIERA